MNGRGASAKPAPGWMPDFCSLPILGSVVLLVELIVVIVLIAPGQGGWPTLRDLFAASFLAQWVAMISAVLLCKLGPWLGRRRFWLGGVIATLLPAHLARRDYPPETFVTARVVRPALHQQTWMAYTTQRAASLAVRTVGRLLRELSPALSR